MSKHLRNSVSRFVSRLMQVVLILVVLFGSTQLLLGQKTPKAQSPNPPTIESMSLQDRDALRKKRNKFNGLSEVQKTRLREFHRTLEAHSSSDQLKTVMRKYYEWLNTLDDSQLIELLDQPPAKRILEIKRIKREQALKRFGRTDSEAELPARDAYFVYTFFTRLFEEKAPTILAHLKTEEMQQRMRERKEDWELLGFRVFRARDLDYWLGLDRDFFLELFFSEFDVFRNSLSQPALEILDRYNDSPLLQEQLILNWFREALEDMQEVSDAELRAYAETLSAKERDTLDRMTPENRKKSLRNKFLGARRRARESSSTDKETPSMDRSKNSGSKNVDPKSGANYFRCPILVTNTGCLG